MKSKKITLIVHNLSSNPIVRAYPLALSLVKSGYSVEIVGFSYFNEGIYYPYRKKEISIKNINLNNFGLIQYLLGLSKLLKLMDGDYIYAFKPLLTTFFPAIIKSAFGLRKKLMLDVEDDELYFHYRSNFDFFYNFFIRGWNNPNSHRNRLILNCFKRLPSIITVVSTKLQKRYGGTILLHGPDEHIFDRERFDKLECKNRFSIPSDKVAILFAGIPHPHKGLDLIINAICNNNNYVLICAGPKDSPMFIQAKNKLGNRAYLLGSLPNDKMPELLAATDIVPLLQHKNRFTESQIPAKLIEAMAMSSVIVSTPASDISKILGRDSVSKRGKIIDFNSVQQLSEFLLDFENNKQKFDTYAKNARVFYLKNASINSNSKIYNKLLK